MSNPTPATTDPTIDDVPPGKHSLAIMDRTGDTKLLWSKDNPVEVENARATFNNLRAKGYLIYKVVGEKGDKGEHMVTFDPDAERMIATPAPRGG